MDVRKKVNVEKRKVFFSLIEAKRLVFTPCYQGGIKAGVPRAGNAFLMAMKSTAIKT